MTAPVKVDTAAPQLSDVNHADHVDAGSAETARRSRGAACPTTRARAAAAARSGASAAAAGRRLLRHTAAAGRLRNAFLGVFLCLGWGGPDPFFVFFSFFVSLGWFTRVNPLGYSRHRKYYAKRVKGQKKGIFA